MWLNKFLWECCNLFFIIENLFMLVGYLVFSRCILWLDFEVFENIIYNNICKIFNRKGDNLLYVLYNLLGWFVDMVNIMLFNMIFL